MIDLEKLNTYPIKERKNLVSVKDFKRLDSLYEPCADPSLKKLAQSMIQAKKGKRKTILMFGAHLIKLGLSPYIIELMRQGFISHLATTGAGSIHDFEISFIGATSEDVSSSIEDGRFGMARETPLMMNTAINESTAGYGDAIAGLVRDKNLKFKEYSIFYHASVLGIPLTVHVAIGTDIIHQHPSCDGAALGRASYNDFKTFVGSVASLQDGVIINLGSAVVLPEVFLKALSISRNLGYKVSNFTAANLDMISHYRPTVNVLNRPTATSGQGLNVIARHESTIPTLYHYVTEA
ncbi:MAG: hypothetical protein V1837_08535 [Candidatus Woesearchaeota archaeon]